VAEPAGEDGDEVLISVGVLQRVARATEQARALGILVLSHLADKTTR